jgi:hypothetical protein
VKCSVISGGASVEPDGMVLAWEIRACYNKINENKD